MNIIIIGGNGFVGRNIQEILSAAPDINTVTSVSRENEFNLLNEKQNSKHERILQQADYIINCAASVGSLNYVSERAAEIIDTNSKINLNLYKIVKNLEAKALIINPIATCGFPGELELYNEANFYNGPIHKSVLAYGATCRLLVEVTECYRMQYGIKSINYYTPSMYGEFDSTDPNKAHALNAIISKVVKAINMGTDLTIWGTGKPIREWLYVKDFARIILETILRHRTGEDFSHTINIGQNTGVSINHILDIIVPMSGYEGNVNYDLTRQDGALSKVMDDNLFRKRFPTFEFTELTKGCLNTVNYYDSIYPY